MIRDIRYEEIPFYGLFLSSLKLVFWTLADENGARLSFSSLCLACLIFLNNIF